MTTLTSSRLSTETRENGSSESSSLLTANSKTLLIVVVVACVICAFLVCSCWIISYLVFKQKSLKQTITQQTIEMNEISGARIGNKKLAKVQSVTLSDIKTLGSASPSTSKLKNGDIDICNNLHGEHSNSVSDLFNEQDSRNTKGHSDDDIDVDEKNCNDNYTTNVGETLDAACAESYGVVTALAEYGDNGGEGDGGEGDGNDDGDADGAIQHPIGANVTTNGIRGNGVGLIGSLDENRYQQWTEKQVLLWLKENLLNNGVSQDDAKNFLKEFAKMKIVGGTLHGLKTDNNSINQFKKEFSPKNQAFGIWIVVRNCIQNVGQNIHVD